MMALITENWLYDLIGIFIALIAISIAYCKWAYTYWERKGLVTPTPKIPLGNGQKTFLQKQSLGETFKDFYEEFKSKGYKHCGIYFLTKPIYVPTDIEIIKNIMQKDFQHFVNHGTYMNEKDDPLSAHLFSLEDAKWKKLREKLTPTFTSGKLKMMFQTLVNCTKELKVIMNSSVGKPVDIKEILGRFTTDIIGSCAFGLECNSLKDPDAEFRKNGRRVFEVDMLESFKAFCQFSLPRKLLNALGVKAFKTDVTKFFSKVIKETVDYREKNNVHRKDFMHLLIQLKNRGVVTDDDKIKNENGIIQSALTMDELTAQAFVFFLAGFETSSTTMTFALYELATNPDVQQNLRQEINKVLAKYDNKMTYEAMMEMEYMEKVINETLRKYPPVPVLNRECNKDYVIPGTDVVIERGISVFIPVLGIHNDPEYYPEPEKFKPERFNEENKNKRPGFTFLPFGEGPRICIGLRFGLMQTKVGLTALLQNYKISLNENTKSPLTMDPIQFVSTAKGGVWLNVEKI